MTDKDIKIEVDEEINAIEIKGIEPGKEASKESIGKVLTKLQQMFNQNLVDAEKKRTEFYTTENFTKLFKIMYRQDKPIPSRVRGSWVYFWARKPKSCTGCKLYDQKCLWGFETYTDGKKVRPQKGTCCVPFKVRGYTVTEEEVERHIESIIAHVNDFIDTNKSLFDLGVLD